MNKLITKLIALVMISTTIASPAIAKSFEYNFNTCTYNHYTNVDPYSRQPAYAPSAPINQGIGQPGAAAENLRTSIPVSLYEQTPQRTITIPNRRPQRKVINTNNYQPIQQQQMGYVYIPGQNGKAAQNYNQGGIGYQYNSSGAATYESVSSDSSKQAQSSSSSKP